MEVVREEQSGLAKTYFLDQILCLIRRIRYLDAESDESELERSFDDVAVVEQRDEGVFLSDLDVCLEVDCSAKHHLVRQSYRLWTP